MRARLEKFCIIIAYLAILALLGCFVVPASLGAINMTIGGLNVTSAAANKQKMTSNAQRLPQVPLDVEQYPVAPSGLQLEQVHVFVRHGTSLQLLPQSGILAVQFFRSEFASINGRLVFVTGPTDLKLLYSINKSSCFRLHAVLPHFLFFFSLSCL
jgi:hypothetical protein